MSEPTIDSVFPILARIKDVPLEVCKAAYGRLDTSSPGDQIDDLNIYAPLASSAREFIEVIWPGMVEENNFEKWKPSHYEDFALAIEYAHRIGKT